MNTSELARVVVRVALGVVPEFGAPLAIADAAPVSADAPENVTTRIEFATDRFSVAVTVIAACAAGVNAHQTSAVPSWVFDRAASVQVSAVPELTTVLAMVFAPAVGASAETKATTSVLAAGVTVGLTIVCDPWLFVTTFCTTAGAAAAATLLTVTVTAADVAVLPAVSRARAVSV